MVIQSLWGGGATIGIYNAATIGTTCTEATICTTGTKATSST